MPVSRISLHKSGPMVSRLILGAWRLAEWQMSTKELLDLLHGCIELGVTTIDHADIYGGYSCEGLFGAALAEEPALREQLQLVTKCGIKLVSPERPTHGMNHYDTSREHILASVDNSLRELRTDYVDLLLIHRPDPFMDADETAEAFEQLRRSGKVRFFGVSNFMPHHYDLLASRLDFPLVTNQLEISVQHLAAFYDGTLDQCQRLRISPMAWSPLGGGSLFSGDTPQATRLRETLTAVGDQLGGATIDQVAIAWLLAHPARIVPILGTGKLSRVEAAVQAEALTLSREQWFEVLRASNGRDVP